MEQFMFLFWLVPVSVIFILLIVTSVTTVKQGFIGVTETFGKYKRILSPGLNFKTPFIERVTQRISTQNTTTELGFQAVTADQANVNFKAMLIYRVLDSSEENIKKVAYAFNQGSFDSALARTIEGSMRALVATKKQAEILGLRTEIVGYVKENVDSVLQEWGYHLIDLQINDITFDQAVMESMSRVVAAINNKTAAENEGEADKIRKTKEAEGDQNAAIIRAKGVAESRKILSDSVAETNEKVMHMMFVDKYCDTMKHMAEFGKGKVIFMDTSGDTMKNMIANMQENTKSEKSEEKE